MNGHQNPATAWARAVVQCWDQFWFTPAQPHTLALIRILGGAMLLYTHAVWTLDLEAFLGPRSWLSTSTVAFMNQEFSGPNYTWSYLFWINSPAGLWTAHIAALVVFLLLTLGCCSRVMSILACLITLSYCHRLTGTLFGLDQINAFIALYLTLGSCGDAYSLDRWFAGRRGDTAPAPPAIGSNIAVRLLQLHMCVIYLFGGIGKMQGDTWWDGSALWFAFASLEYQSVDMTWTVRYRWALALLTHLTVFWETFYCFLVWPKLTRPVCLALAVLVHAGIGICLGMKTFGLAMIIANLAFVAPETVQAAVTWLCRRPFGRSSAGAQAAAQGPRSSLAVSRPASLRATTIAP
jgi:Vitamin K-dependent gamma-carboxylase